MELGWSLVVLGLALVGLKLGLVWVALEAGSVALGWVEIGMT